MCAISEVHAGLVKLLIGTGGQLYCDLLLGHFLVSGNMVSSNFSGKYGRFAFPHEFL